jgi:hypothetical protein
MGASAATTLLDGGTSTVSPDGTPRSQGTVSGITATLQADTSHGALNETVTLPAGATGHTFKCVSTIRLDETSF